MTVMQQQSTLSEENNNRKRMPNRFKKRITDSYKPNPNNAYMGKSRLTETLKKLMEEISISEAELARKTAIPQPTLHRILSGATLSPRGNSLAPLANFFSVTINQLLGDDPLPKDRVVGAFNERVQGWKSLPVLSWQQTSKWDTLKTDLSNWSDWTSTDFPASADSFGLRVVNDAMAPRFPIGTILIVDPKAKVQNRDFVILVLEGQQTAVFKQLLVDGEDIYLKSLSEGYRTIHVPKKPKILGVLVQARTDFRGAS